MRRRRLHASVLRVRGSLARQLFSSYRSHAFLPLSCTDTTARSPPPSLPPPSTAVLPDRRPPRATMDISPQGPVRCVHAEDDAFCAALPLNRGSRRHRELRLPSPRTRTHCSGGRPPVPLRIRRTKKPERATMHISPRHTLSCRSFLSSTPPRTLPPSFPSTVQGGPQIMSPAPDSFCFICRA